MLKSLNIKNYAIIDNLSIDFEKGFNAFTGETGAGKSIIVGALSFLLKGRSDSSVIKTGKDKAIIEGIFDVKDKEIISKLKEQEIEVENEIIVRRIISVDNHNSIKINETSVTLSFLTDLFSKFVDIHSQKDNHFLFNKKNQLSLLDRYVDDYSILNEYNLAYENYLKQLNEYNSLINSTFNEKEIEYLKYDLKELEDAELSLDEEVELEAKEKRYKSAEKYINALQEAISFYDNNYGIKENLRNIINLLRFDDEQISNVSNRIENSYYELDENISELKNILSSFEENDLNIEHIEERLYLYSKLKRKHKTDVSGLLELKESISKQILLFEDKDRIIEKQNSIVKEAYNKAFDLAKTISDKRLKASKELSIKVINESNDLLLNNIKFDVMFDKVDLNQNGIDDIEFVVSLNKGEDMKPLRNVASGGEISRLMLALKVVFAKLSNTELIILDEIDSGVSGKVALAVGEKIAKISKDVQVLCITHLAPVAACANANYLIYKQDNDTSTYTSVRKIENDEIISQLAIISNTSTDPKALAAAKELYTTCQKLVNETK